MHPDATPTSGESPQARARVGRTVADRYLLLRVLGEGGMGTVYEARHQRTKQRVAVKILHAHKGWSTTAVARLLREAQVANAIGHPNIVEAYDAGIDADGAAYVVFRLLEGESAAALMEREGRLPVARALGIAIEVLDTLIAAHARGVVHRDIKPRNVYLAGEERAVKLLDFGIAKLTQKLPDGQSTITDTGAVIGTPDYMSPEQVRGADDVDGRTDLWSVGVMLFEMLTHRRPFAGANVNMVVYSILTDPPVTPGEAGVELSPALRAVLDRAMQKDRSVRYQTAAEMKAELQRALASPDGASTPAREVAPTEASLAAIVSSPTRTRRSLAAVGVALAALAAGGWLLTGPHGRVAVVAARRPAPAVAIAPPSAAPPFVAPAPAPQAAASAVTSASVAPRPAVARHAPVAVAARPVGRATPPPTPARPPAAWQGPGPAPVSNIRGL